MHNISSALCFSIQNNRELLILIFVLLLTRKYTLGYKYIWRIHPKRYKQDSLSLIQGILKSKLGVADLDISSRGV